MTLAVSSLTRWLVAFRPRQPASANSNRLVTSQLRIDIRSPPITRQHALFLGEFMVSLALGPLQSSFA